jgi:hypothetical protein
MVAVTRDDILAFVRRDWAAVEHSKREYWAARFRDEGPRAAREASTLLLQHARRVGIDLLDERARRTDLADHLKLRDRLDRTSRAFAGR